MKPGYKVEVIGPVKEQGRILADRAAAAGIGREYLQAWHDILKELRTRPLDWGDPERKTRKEGGLVCHGLRRPLLYVQYVVFEPERYVCILKLNPLTDSRLE